MKHSVFAYMSILFGSRTRVSQIECLGTRIQFLGSNYNLHVLTDQRNISWSSKLRIIYAPNIRSQLHHGRRLLVSSKRHETMNKILLWNLTEFSRIIYMDPDIYIQRLPDTLFTINFRESIAAVHGCNGYFNSGFIVLRPNKDLFKRLLTSIYAKHNTACDRSPDRDQSVLNGFFRNDWMHLDSQWNRAIHYKQHGNYSDYLHKDSNIHFTAENKPHNLCNTTSW